MTAQFFPVPSAERTAFLPPQLPDTELDVVITVRDADQPAQAFHSFAHNHLDLGWIATMSQVKVLPITVAAHSTLTSNGQTRDRGAVPVSLSGEVSLYDPRTDRWEHGVAVPAMRGVDGTLTFDPRSTVTQEFPWVGAIGLTVSATSWYGVGLRRQIARTVVQVGGFIGYIN
jgi:hypothetical protein